MLRQWYRFVGYLLVVGSVFVVLGCGGGGATTNPDNNTTNPDTNDTLKMNYKGLYFYYLDKDPAQYKLAQLSDSDFDALSDSAKLQVANKLLNTLFFGYKLADLKAKISSGSFISDIRNSLTQDLIDRGKLEDLLSDDTYFEQSLSTYSQPQAVRILARFYAMDKLDKYYLNNWVAYILTQTILFSPAYELTSTHSPNIAGVYNRLVTMLEVQNGMRFITYVHMMSEDNWRRFRSPEDNGREMLEIYTLDTADSHVPLAGQALRNWKLDTDSDTLVIGLNRNTKPVSLFGTTVYTGEDFYRELVKSDAFVRGVTTRLVDFFFDEMSATAKSNIVDDIVDSKPETWKDILMQIVFSKQYLLDNHRAQSAEETFFSLGKKIDFRWGRRYAREFKDSLQAMHQASMKYKLGKLERVPMDTLSFANYHKYIREKVLLKKADASQNDPKAWNYGGWQESFVGSGRFVHDSSDDVATLHNMVNYIFESILGRSADADEQSLFEGHMIHVVSEKHIFKNEFDLYYTNSDAQKQAEGRSSRARHIAIAVMDYISRLAETYRQSEVK